MFFFPSPSRSLPNLKDMERHPQQPLKPQPIKKTKLGANHMSVQCESRPTQPTSQQYIHGFTRSEQDRLIRQSTFFEPYVYTHIDFSKCHHILEVGCGVGAQINLLLRRWSHLKITGIDISATQISRAHEVLRSHVDSGRVVLQVSDGGALPFANNTFDGALICFVLEHANNPIALFQELKRVTQPGSSLYCTEAFNAGLDVDPPCPAFTTYLEIFNQYQQELQGDPNVGAKLCNLALKSGFSKATLHHVPAHLDSNTQGTVQREFFLEVWTDCLLSAAPALLAQNKITGSLIEAMKQEFHSIKSNLDSVFVYPMMQVKAVN